MAVNSLLSGRGITTTAFPSLLSSSTSTFSDRLPASIGTASAASSSRLVVSVAEWIPGQHCPAHIYDSSPRDIGAGSIGARELGASSSMDSFADGQASYLAAAEAKSITFADQQWKISKVEEE